jgi:hypothetical protein
LSLSLRRFGAHASIPLEGSLFLAPGECCDGPDDDRQKIAAHQGQADYLQRAPQTSGREHQGAPKNRRSDDQHNDPGADAGPLRVAAMLAGGADD